MRVPPGSYYKAADTAAPTVLIRDIRGLPRRSCRAKGVIRGLSEKFPNFLRKGSKNFTQYFSEQPEMTTQ